MSNTASMDFDLDIGWNQVKENIPQGALTSKQNFKDERFWKITRDEAGNGSAVIRLLIDTDKVAFVHLKKYEIVVQNGQSKKYYIENSPVTIGKNDPAYDEYQRLNAIGTEEAKEYQKLFKFKTRYITNILVINDPANPQNNGKVFLFDFGKKLLDKFTKVLEPSEADLSVGIKPLDLYNFVKGANVLLRTKIGATKIPDFDDTTFLEPSPICNSKEECMALWNKTYKLKDFHKEENFKSYEELEKKLRDTFGGVLPSERLSGGVRNVGATAVPQATAQATQPAPTVQQTVQNTVQPTVQETAPATQPAQVSQPQTATPTNSDDDMGFLDDI